MKKVIINGWTWWSDGTHISETPISKKHKIKELHFTEQELNQLKWELNRKE